MAKDKPYMDIAGDRGKNDVTDPDRVIEPSDRSGGPAGSVAGVSPSQRGLHALDIRVSPWIADLLPSDRNDASRKELVGRFTVTPGPDEPDGLDRALLYLLHVTVM